MARSTEAQISQAICLFLEAKGKKNNLAEPYASIGEIRKNLPNFINLTAEDKALSPTRPGEQLWEQIVRNVVCHRKQDGNFIHDGQLVYLKKGQLSLA